MRSWNERYPSWALKAEYPGVEYAFEALLRAKSRLLEVAKRDEPLSDTFKGLSTAIVDSLGVDFVEVLEFSGDVFQGRAWHKQRSYMFVDFSEDQPNKVDTEVSLKSYAGFALHEIRSLAIEDYEAEKRFSLPPHLEAYRVKSGVTTPIEVGGRLWGVLAVHHQEHIHFLEEEIAYLEEAASLAGTILSRNLKHEKMRQDRDAAERLLWVTTEASQTVGMAGNSQDAAQAVARFAVANLSDLCWVELVKDEAGSSTIERVAIESANHIESAGRLTTKVPRSRPFNPNGLHGTPHVLRTGQAEVVEDVGSVFDATSSSNDEYLKLVKKLTGGSYICLPLSAGRTRIGSINFVATKDNRSLGKKAMEGAEALAAVLALGLKDKLTTTEPKGATQDAQIAAEIPSITPLEREAIQNFDKGLDPKQAAKAMNMPVDTLRNHITNLHRKLGVDAYHKIPGRARELDVLADNPTE